MPVVHFVQVFYALAFAAVFSAPLLLRPATARDALGLLGRQPLLVAIATLGVAACIGKYTSVRSSLLALIMQHRASFPARRQSALRLLRLASRISSAVVAALRLCTALRPGRHLPPSASRCVLSALLALTWQRPPAS